MILELIADTFVSGGIAIGLLAAKNRFNKFRRIKPDSLGALPWAWMSHGDHNGLYCPKCINVSKNTIQPPFCACEDYHTGHFHFKCGDCGYTSIMKTADDRD